MTDDLTTRLAALEASAPSGDPPQLAGRGRHAHLGTPMLLGGLMAVAMVASAAAGGAVVANLAHGSPGVENAGQPLAGAGLECMSPPDAAAYLADRGFTDVVWQVESGASGSKTGSSVQQAFPPAHGYVVPAAILSDGKLYMVVDQRPGATGTGACPDLPMP